MKLSQLKQIIKEEINELGFDYPGKEQTPSAYQNGIMDTLKAIQQLGVNVDIQAVMDIIYPEDENPINEVDMGFVGDVALGVVGGFAALYGITRGIPSVLGALGAAAAETAERMADKAKQAAMKAKKEGRLDTIKPIVAKFEDDEELKNMYQDLTPKDNGVSSKARENNALRAKQLQAIAKYIKSKLTPEEMKYFTDVSSMMRTGDINEGRINEGKDVPLTNDVKRYIDAQIKDAKKSRKPEKLKKYLTNPVVLGSSSFRHLILLAFEDKYPDAIDVTDEVKKYILSQM